MDAKIASQVSAKGLKYTFWQEIAQKEKKMLANESKLVTNALKSYQRLGIQPNGSIEAGRLDKPEDAAAIVGAVDAVEAPMGKIYKALKADKHWKKAIENYEALLTAIRAEAAPKAGNETAEAPAKGGATFAVADVEGNLKAVEAVVTQITQGLPSLDAHYEAITNVLLALDEPGADPKVQGDKGNDAVRDLAVAVQQLSKTYGGARATFSNMAEPSEINPTDKALGDYTQRHAAAVKSFTDMGKTLEDAKQSIVDNQKRVKAAIDGIMSKEDALNKDLLKGTGSQKDDDSTKTVVKETGQSMKMHSIAYKTSAKMKSLFYTIDGAQQTIEELTNALLSLDGGPNDRLEQLKSIQVSIKPTGEKVKEAAKSVKAAEGAISLLLPPDKLQIENKEHEQTYRSAYTTLPTDVKRAKASVAKAMEDFRALLDTYTQARQAATV